MKDFKARLKEVFEQNSDKILVHDLVNGVDMTYAEVLGESLKLSVHLENKGVEVGDRVAFSLNNGAKLLQIYLACMHIGATAAPVNKDLPDDKKEKVVEKLKPELFIEKYPEETSDDAEKKPFKGLKENSQIIFHTSGTTDTPKGVLYDYSSIHGNLQRISENLEFESFVAFNHLPMSWLASYHGATLLPLINGGKIVLTDNFGPEQGMEYWEIVQKYEVDFLMLVPSIIRSLLEIDRQRKESGELFALCGTAPITSNERKKFEKRFDIPVYEFYGLSEANFVSMNSKGQKRRSVGKVIDGCEVEIIRDGKPVEEGTGSIWVKSKYSLERYLFEEEERGEHFFLTGDMGRMDEEGYIHIDGREKDMIIRKSKKINPKHIENVLVSQPGVETAIIKGEGGGDNEEIHAFIKAENEKREKIIRRCREDLDKTEIPDKITFKTEFPKSATGKVLRGEL